MLFRQQYWAQCGKTKLVENPSNSQTKEICVVYSDIPKEYKYGGGNKITYEMFINYDIHSVETDAYNFASRTVANNYAFHTYEWSIFWFENGINVIGNQTLGTVIAASLFQLVNSLQSSDVYQKYDDLTPITHISHGSMINDPGHVTYETELWLHQPLLLINTEWSTDIINYRIKLLNTAISNAVTYQQNGVRYPIKSGYSGVELSNNLDEILHKLYVTGAISMAVRNHYSGTMNEEFLRNGGCKIAIEIAKFYQDLITFNNQNEYYEIKSKNN